jgi:hypothetical protein
MDKSVLHQSVRYIEVPLYSATHFLTLSSVSNFIFNSQLNESRSLKCVTDIILYL